LGDVLVRAAIPLKLLMRYNSRTRDLQSARVFVMALSEPIACRPLELPGYTVRSLSRSGELGRELPFQIHDTGTQTPCHRQTSFMTQDISGWVGH